MDRLTDFNSQLSVKEMADRQRSSKLAAELQATQARLRALQATLDRQVAQMKFEREKNEAVTQSLSANIDRLAKQMEAIRSRRIVPRDTGK